MKNTQTNSTTYTQRPLEELNLIDDFLFQQLLMQKEDGEEFCRILLSTILGKPISKVRIIPQKNVLGIDTNHHGIRMDAYIEDISEETMGIGTETLEAEVISDIYDVEPNNTYEKKTLPKRMRYYHGLIDTQLLATNIDYDKLPNVAIIIILPYDPFGKNRMVYTIQNQCVEDSAVPYNDGAKKIFLYTKGTEGNPSQELRDMLRYIEHTTTDNITNQNIDTLHHIVEKIKSRKEVGINYMKSWELEKMHREEGLAQGFKEGHKIGLEKGFEEGHEQGIEQGIKQGMQQGIQQGMQQGIQQGMQQGIQQGMQQGIQQGMQQGIQQGMAKGLEEGIISFIRSCQNLNISPNDTLNQLIQSYGLNHDIAKTYLEKYWKTTH